MQSSMQYKIKNTDECIFLPSFSV